MELVVKEITQINKLFTYYRFIPYDEWDDFDIVLRICIDKIRCCCMNKFDLIYMRLAHLVKNDFKFTLMYSEDDGILLYNRRRQNEEYYEKLGKIAYEVAEYIPPL